MRRLISIVLLALIAACADDDAPHDLAYFVDATAEAGIDFVHTSGAAGRYYMPETMGAGGAFIDYNSDGLLDIYLVDGFPMAGIGEEFRPVNLLEETSQLYLIEHTDHIDRAPRTNGAVDTLVYRIQQSGRSPVRNRLYANEGAGRFSKAKEAAGGGDTGYGIGCAVGDYDNDGDPDLYVVNYGPNALLRNDAASFVDVTELSGGGDPNWGASAAFLDADGDGRLDLYVANYVDFHVGNNQICGGEDATRQTATGTHVRVRKDRRSYCSPERYSGAPDVFYRNTGSRFEDVTRASGLFSPHGKGLGVVAADYDSDGDTDIYVANDGVRNFLYRNDGAGRFSEVALTAGVAYNRDGRAEAGMGVDWGDYDGDADFDLFVTNYSKQSNTFYRNEGAGRFNDMTDLLQIGTSSYNPLGFGTFFFEADNDGDLDLFVANGHVSDKVQYVAGNEGIAHSQPNQLFENRSAKAFIDISRQSGPGLQAAAVSRGSAFGDYDNDGDLDILVTNSNGPAQLLRNDLSSKRNWLSVRLIGKRVNRDAVGSRIALTCGGAVQVREVRTSGSYASASDVRQHFGLGDCSSIDNLEVIWHDGTLQTVAPQEIVVNGFLTIEQEEVR